MTRDEMAAFLELPVDVAAPRPMVGDVDLFSGEVVAVVPAVHRGKWDGQERMF